ncbi:hypothetical protein [Nonomuraea sp. GTA35]|uniref:hypothetical protein n=1 Tax=Nonomuraea sp. GTA35 TaxID=1676746 RepID=UPI0035C09697
MNATLDQLRRPASGRRILLTGAAVVTMDPELGGLPRADLLIEGDRIAAVGVDLPAGDAPVIDVAGAVLDVDLVTLCEEVRRTTRAPPTVRGAARVGRRHSPHPQH